jgi:arsenite/tail-anchored protein-transporting ATPase
MRLLLFTGKGGAGKTTVAAATAVHAARCGLRTLVLSADPAHSLGDALAVPLSAVPHLVAPGLYAQQIDVRAQPEKPVDQVQEYLTSVLDQLGVDPLASAELTELPGAQEVLALMEVRDQVREGDWDLVVMDCAPSAETLRLLALPEVLTRYLDRLLPMERRIARIVGLHRTDRTRSGLPIPGDRVVEAAEQFATQLASLDEVLHAAGTSVRLVLTPESVVLSETRRTWTALALHGYCVDEVIANRIIPGAGDPWRESWAAAQERVLADASGCFAPVPLTRLGYAAAEPVGIEALAALAASVHGPPSAQAGAALLEAPDAPGPFAVDRDADGFTLRVPVPLADRADLDLGRRGDDLVVTVSGQRRIVALPSALRRCDVGGAALRDGSLAIRFVPDPAQWRPM